MELGAREQLIKLSFFFWLHLGLRALGSLFLFAVTLGYFRCCVWTSTVLASSVAEHRLEGAQAQ